MSFIQDGNRTILSRALIAIENDDIDHIRQLFTSSGRLELEKAGELLISALELDKRVIASELIDHNVSVYSLNDEISNCLMIAAKKNNLECLDKILARRQININATDLFGWTALMYSCYYGHAECTKSLLMSGAQADIYDNDHMNALIWASGRGYADCVSKLIQFGRAKVNLVDKCGTSPLIWAARKGHTEVVSTLVKAGANIDSIGMFGWSAVLVAVHGNHLETLKLLLQYKPNINTCDGERHTPLIAASKEGKVEIVRLLLKARAFVNLSDDYGHTALIHAAKGAHVEVVDLLLKNHADIDHTGSDKKTALFWAVEKGNLAVVERLLQARPSVEMTSKDGDTCLIKAVKLRKIGIVRVLIAHQAKVSVTDKNGDTILHLAVRMQSATMAQLILANSKNHHLLQRTNKAKKTPIMLDSENSSPVFPALLDILNCANKVHYKSCHTNITTTISSSNFHLDNPQVEFPQPIGEDNRSTSTSSLIKKLATALNNNQPQTQTRVLA